MLFVVEGLDGAGKSTQVSRLRSYLAERCGKVEYIHFPRYDAPVYGGLISRFLRGDFGPLEGVHPTLVALLYAEDRHGAAPAMKAVLENGGTILLDRYVYSNIAYQCAKVSDKNQKEELRRWIEDTEWGVFSLPRPDLNLFLDVPLGFVEESLTRQREGSDRDYLQGKGDIHEADIDFQRRVRDVYLKQCSLDPALRRVDCSSKDGRMLPPDDIFSLVKAEVDKVLG